MCSADGVATFLLVCVGQRFEMIRRIQALQKRLIKTTEEAVERDLLIQEKERLYVELKNILARQPGPEVTEQLAVYQQNLKQKQKQMKAMQSELEMYKAQVNEYKHDIEQLTASMHNIKQQFFANVRAGCNAAIARALSHVSSPIRCGPNAACSKLAVHQPHRETCRCREQTCPRRMPSQRTCMAIWRH